MWGRPNTCSLELLLTMEKKIVRQFANPDGAPNGYAGV